MAKSSLPITEALKSFFETSKEPMLFAGAGVSALAGLPDWKNFLLKLAELVRPKDPMVANLMTEYVSKGKFTRAAEFFWTTDEVLVGDKNASIKKLLSTYDSKPLLPLASLPFKGVLTTNFDRSIFEAVAAARKLAPLDYKLGDVSFKQALFETDLHVARIHGCAEVPSTIILSENQFTRLLENEDYLELLSQTFLRKSILFLGFSFYDPAIKHVLDQIEKKFGQGAPGRHIALLPESNASELIQKAHRLNIEVITYAPTDHHKALWDGIAAYASLLSKSPAKPPTTNVHPYSSTKQYLATCFARASMASEQTSLREIVIEGVLSALLQEAQPKSLGIADIHEKIRMALGIKGREINELIDRGLKSLAAAKLVRKHKEEGQRGPRLVWIGTQSDGSSIEDALQTLTTNIINRAYVQEGWKAPLYIVNIIKMLLRDIVHKRGWDLGAAFATGKAPDIVSIRPQLAECGYRLSSLDTERIERTIESVFEHPTEEEAQILGELGRISFIVELAFQAPRSTLLHKATLPKKLYFDTNVLLPAFVKGHPHYQTFQSTLRRLQEASTKAGNKLCLAACSSYLNEIISHRNNALAYAREAADDFEAIARSDAIYSGPGNINVFVGAYASAIENGRPPGFESFLDQVAPYHTEAELRRWIEAQGFTIAPLLKDETYGELYGILERCNATKLTKGKEPILVEHDALQLALLEREYQSGERTLFVTADRQLYEDVHTSKYGHLADFMVSHVGIVQLVDLLIGLKSDDRVLGELLWNSHISDESKRIRSYLTIEALSRFDAALAMKMHKVVEAQSEAISKQLERAGMDLETMNPTSRAKAFKTLGTLESNFFAGMSEAMEKLHRNKHKPN